VALLDGADFALPAAVLAVTVNVYAVPFLRPITTVEVDPPPTLAVWLPGLDTTV
jgi:hypothetical protein